MSGTLPAFETISAQNQGPAVIVSGYIMIVITILFASIRVGSIFKLKRSFGVDDAFLVVAVLLGLIEAITIDKAADHGLGETITSVSSAKLDKYYKYSYASDLLAVLAMACAKFSVLHLMQRLSAQGMRRVYPVVVALIAAWTILSVFALAFQCGATQPWIYIPAKCAGEGAVWYPIIILNILTDAILAFLFAPIAWKLQMSLTQRVTVAALFGFRLFVCGAAIAQLALLAPALRDQDQTRARTIPAIIEQLVMCLSILAATVPSLHRFLTELQTARLGTHIPTTQYELSQGSNQGGSGWKGSFKPFGSKTFAKSNNKSHNSEKFEEGSGHDMDGRGRVMDFRPDLLDKNQAHIQHDPVHLAETGSRTSDGSQDMIIRQTVAWEVQHYEQDTPDSENRSRAHSQHHAM